MIRTSNVLISIFKIILYRLSMLDIEQWYEKNMEVLSGTRLTEMEMFCSSWFEVTLKKAIYKEAFDVIENHRAEGHRLVIISNSPIFFVKPMAKTLCISDIICSRVEVKDDVLTGKLIKPLCYGEGKRFYAQQWANENQIDLTQSYFYTDSYYDIAFMEAIGNPVATNPDMKLKKAAVRANWPILVFRKNSMF